MARLNAASSRIPMLVSSKFILLQCEHFKSIDETPLTLVEVICTFLSFESQIQQKYFYHGLERKFKIR